jgi:deazaflavin-dependent oxidoreductase (nitroreductase family)
MSKTYTLGPTRRAMNLIMTSMLKAGVGSKSTYLLTTRGRTSGLPRTTPVVLVETAGKRWLVSPYGQVGWVHNVRATPEVTLRRGRSSQTLQAHELPAEAAGPVLKSYLRQARITAPFFDARADDPPQAFAAEADRHPVFELTPPTGPGPGSDAGPGAR